MTFKEAFGGRNPSHFQKNNFIQSFIISDTFLWTAWNLFTPIFAVFITNNIQGGNVAIAGSVVSVYLIMRVIFELLSGKLLTNQDEKKRFGTSILGMIILSIAYVGLAFTKTLISLFLFAALTGVALGIASPARLTLFSVHLDKNKESLEWGIHDAAIFIGMSLAGALGGFIASKYGFQDLFLIAAVVNLFAIVPYILYMKKKV